MKNQVNNSQSTAAVNSAISNMFSKKSVLDFAVYAYNKMAKSSNGNSDKISVVVGDGYRVTMDSGMHKGECRLIFNIYLEEKNGNRYVRMREYHSGWIDMATEYMYNGSWKSVVVYAIKDAIESMVSKVLDSYIKNGDDYSIREWEKITGMVYEAPTLEDTPILEQDVVNRVVDVIKENYNNYLPSYLDQFGDCVITVYWDEFNEDDMKMLIENEKVAFAVRDVLLSDNIILDKDGFLVYDDGVYLTVDYDKIAKKIDVAPSLEDDITEEGYSVSGLNYLRENMVDADMEDIVDEAYEEVSNDLYVWLNELFRSGECPKNEFMDTMWAYAWDIIRDRGLSDEALEAETRYYVEFDDIVERRLEEWGLYERYNNIHMERAYSNR